MIDPIRLLTIVAAVFACSRSTMAVSEAWANTQNPQAVQDTVAKAVGIKGEPTLVHPEKERKSMLDLIFGDVSDYLPSRAKLMETNVGFYYLWK